MGAWIGWLGIMALTGSQSLPITQNPVQLSSRLGGPLGDFSAGQLALMGPPGIVLLTKAANSKDQSVRRDAALGLGMADERLAFLPLLQLLLDSDPNVVESAFRSINVSIFMDRPELVRAARTEPRKSALRVLDFLYGLPYHDPDLVAVASDPTSTVRAEALRALTNTKMGFDLAFNAIVDPRSDVKREAAAILLMRANTPARKDLVHNLAAQASVPTRIAFGAASQSSNVEAPRWLIELMAHDSIPENRRLAADWTANHFRWERKPEYLTELARIVNDPDPKMGEIVVTALASLGGDNGSRPDPFDAPKLIGQPAAGQLYRGLSKFLTTEYSAQAAIALAFVGSDRGWDVLAKTLYAANYQDRLAAIMAFGNLKEKRAIPLLIPLLEDGNLLEFTLRSIGKIGDKSIVPFLVTRMENTPDSWRNQLMARAIKAIGGDAARAELLRFAKSLSDPLRRSAYLEALGILGGSDVLIFLTEQLKSGSPWLPYSALNGLSLMNDPAADEVLQAIIQGLDAALAKAAKNDLGNRRDARRY